MEGTEPISKFKWLTGGVTAGQSFKSNSLDHPKSSCNCVMYPVDLFGFMFLRLGPEIFKCLNLRSFQPFFSLAKSIDWFINQLT